MKAVNQSIGRAVRHINDYATILLLDERYDRPKIKSAIPDFIRSSLKVSNFHETFEQVSKVGSLLFSISFDVFFLQFFETKKRC